MRTDFLVLTISPKGYLAGTRDDQGQYMLDCMYANGPCARFCGVSCVAFGPIFWVPGVDRLRVPGIRICSRTITAERIIDQRSPKVVTWEGEKEGEKIRSELPASGQENADLNRSEFDRDLGDRTA